jgi:galactose mutarotase-like enzyme
VPVRSCVSPRRAFGKWGKTRYRLATRPTQASRKAWTTFSGWSGYVSLTDSVMRCDLRSDVQHLVVFTTPEKDFVAIEPVSHANNAMNAGNPKESEARGVRILQSGQSWQISMSINASLNR